MMFKLFVEKLHSDLKQKKKRLLSVFLLCVYKLNYLFEKINSLMEILQHVYKVISF